MSVIESVLNEYKRNIISKDTCVQRAINILENFYNEIAKDQGKLLDIIRNEGGNDWVYDKLPLSDNGGYSLSYSITKYKSILTEPFHKKGFEGIILYLDVNSIDIFLKIRYVK